MHKFREKLNNIPKAGKVFIRIFYPIVLYILIHFLIIQNFRIEERTVQFVFVLLWGALEWYFFLSYNYQQKKKGK